MLPISAQLNVQLGSLDTEVVATDKNVVGVLNAPFIPVLATHFLGRDTIVRKVLLDCQPKFTLIANPCGFQVKAGLARKVRVCNIYGARGVGKSSIAIHIAKMAYRTRGYRNGVHYFAVDKLVEHIQSAHRPETDSEDQDSQSTNQREDPLPVVIEGVETLLRSLPEYVLPENVLYGSLSPLTMSCYCAA